MKTPKKPQLYNAVRMHWDKELKVEKVNWVLRHCIPYALAKALCDQANRCIMPDGVFYYVIVKVKEPFNVCPKCGHTSASPQHLLLSCTCGYKVTN
jgi:hypothetical protein